MKHKSTIIVLLGLGLFFLTALSVLAQDIDNPLSIPGRIQGTGTYFEIKDSKYLNVSLQSSEEITITLESIPKTISLIIEASSVYNSTVLTFSNLEPDTTYYKFEDSYKNKVEFTTDETGKYIFTQDLTQNHHIWFQPGDNGTVFLPEECSTYGIWDEPTSTCALTQDLTESVEITTDNTTLDCSNYNISGVDTGYGIYLIYKLNIEIQDCSVNNFSYGIYPILSSNIVLNNNVIEFNYYGIYLLEATGSILTNNRMLGNTYNFYIDGGIDSNFNLNIDTTNSVDGKPIYYIKNANNQIYDDSTNAGTFYCIFCDNVIIKDLTLTKNGHGIFFWKTQNSKVENVSAVANNIGIALFYSHNNTFTNNVVNLNTWIGTFFINSDNNTLHGNTVNLNSEDGIYIEGSGNILINNNVSSNRYGVGITLHGGFNIVDGNTIMNNPLGIATSPDNNTFINNNILNNATGISINNSNNNKVYHNNFIDNDIQAEVYEGAGNLFDNGYLGGGNYWSDYRGVDEKSGPNQDQPGSDGIGDMPYNILSYPPDPPVEDRYPFMEESGWEKPPVPTYNIAVILAEPANVPHESESKTYRPCKLFPEKIYPSGRSKEYYQDLAYCVADYHKENSFETINLNFTIYDNNEQWFKTDKNEEDYVDKEHEFVIDAIASVAGVGIDLSGKDIVIVLHSGTSSQREKNKLDTQTWRLASQPLGYPPYKIIAAEDDLVGGWAHEIGHIVGALLTPKNTITPDLSDMGFSSVFTLFGKRLDILHYGAWDIMAEGSWNDNGSDPSYMSSYTKEFLQWFNYDIHPKSAYGEYWINSLDTSGLSDDVFRYNLSEDVNDESPGYYLLEARNRNLKTWDSSLPEEKALILYRVDTHNFLEYGYDEEGWMWNKYRSITIPGGIREYLVNDGVLTPDGETYRDFDNLVKFTALTDRTIDAKYEIQAEIKEITYDSFGDNFWGVILKPNSFFRQKIERISPLNPVKIPEFLGDENNSKMLLARVCGYNPQTGEYECTGGAAPARTITKKEIIQYFLVILIPLLLLIILLVILNKKVVPHLESERKRKIIKIFIKIFLIISIIFVVILSLLTAAVISEMPDYSDINGSREIATPSLLPLTFPDLDLHLYTEDGKHIGMNYETGEYEIQIEGAIISGDTRDAPEWIFVPPYVTNYHFVVSSYDNQKFLEENPEIAQEQEIEDATDSYEIYARYIDPETAIYTSATISEDINLGQEIEHQISGTHDIVIEPGALIISISDVIEDVKISYDLGWITKPFVKTILIAKLKVAQQLEEQKEKQLKHFDELIEKAKNPKVKQALEKAKEKYEEAMNKAITAVLKSFIKEVEIYTKKGWITKQASDLLINDANYIIEHL